MQCVTCVAVCYVCCSVLRVLQCVTRSYRLLFRGEMQWRGRVANKQWFRGVLQCVTCVAVCNVCCSVFKKITRQFSKYKLARHAQLLELVCSQRTRVAMCVLQSKCCSVSVAMRVLQCCSVLQRVATCCSVLQCVAVCCSVLQCVAVCYVCCSVLQCVAVCCSVLQCVAVCCSVKSET